MPLGRMPRGALSLTGGTVYNDDVHKKPGQAATQSVDLAAISAAKLASGTAAAWHPDGIVAAELQGENPGIFSLLVVEKERVSGGKLVVDGTAYVAPAAAAGPTAGRLAVLYEAMQPTCLLQHCGGSDCAFTVSAVAPDGLVVPPGCVALDAVQRMNLHVAHNTLYQFELVPREPAPLVDIQVLHTPFFFHAFAETTAFEFCWRCAATAGRSFAVATVHEALGADQRSTGWHHADCYELAAVPARATPGIKHLS